MIGARVELDLKPVEGLQRSGIRKATRIGLNRAAAPVKASVVSHAAAVKLWGFLARAIRIKLKSYPADRFVAVIGPSSKFKRTKGKITRGPRKGQKRVIIPSRYAAILENGSKRSRPRPWLKPAYTESAAAFLARAAAEVEREIAAELARKQAAK